MGMWQYEILLSMLLALAFCEEESGHDFFTNPKDKRGYKIMYISLPWEKAKESCAREGFTLAVPRTREQFDFIQKIVRSMNYTLIQGTTYNTFAWLGISNQENYQIWENIDGEDIRESEFHTWAEENGNSFSADVKEPHCAGIDAFNRGLREYWCNRRQPYICETQIIDMVSGIV